MQCTRGSKIRLRFDKRLHQASATDQIRRESPTKKLWAMPYLSKGGDGGGWGNVKLPVDAAAEIPALVTELASAMSLNFGCGIE